MRFILLMLLSLSAAAETLTCEVTDTASLLALSCARTAAPPVIPPVIPPTQPPPVQPPSDCKAPSFVAQFTSPGQFFEYSLANGQVAALAFPVIKPNGWVESAVFQSTATPADLQAVGTISGQPGCISTTVPACTASGSAWSSIDLHGQVAPGYCPIAAGLVYYMNVTVTNCAQDRCTLRTQYWGGGQ